jgi:hypothetical protein
MGYYRLDDLLHTRNPGVPLLPTTLLVLEDGRLFLVDRLAWFLGSLVRIIRSLFYTSEVLE